MKLTKPMRNILRCVANWRDGKGSRPFVFSSDGIRASVRLVNEGFVVDLDDGPDITESGRLALACP